MPFSQFYSPSLLKLISVYTWQLRHERCLISAFLATPSNDRLLYVRSPDVIVKGRGIKTAVIIEKYEAVILVRPIKDFERVDPSLFRAFMAAVEAQNFTQGAKRAAMTQSGVSQHIAKLEGQLGVELFKRVNRSVLLTDAGRELALYVERYLDDMDSLCERLRLGVALLEGTVVYAMPGSCLLSPHLGMMLERRKEHPGIELRILIRPNEEIIRDLLAGELDFGFITRTTDIPGLDLIPFCNEEFILVSADSRTAKMPKREDLIETRFVSYPGMESYFDLWQRHFFSRVKAHSFESLKICGHVESISGAVTLAVGGVGAGVFPRHCVQAELERRTLFEANPNPKKQPVLNTIYIARVANQRMTKRVQRVIDWFLEMHPEVAR